MIEGRVIPSEPRWGRCSYKDTVKKCGAKVVSDCAYCEKPFCGQHREQHEAKCFRVGDEVYHSAMGVTGDYSAEAAFCQAKNPDPTSIFIEISGEVIEVSKNLVFRV